MILLWIGKKSIKRLEANLNLSELGKRAKTINVKQLALVVLENNEGLINKRVREQLTVGENGKGGNVGKYVSPYYSWFKQRIGSQAPAGVVDLKVSGKLHNELFTKFEGFTAITDSNVDYAKYQKERYGETAFELQDENTKDVEAIASKKIIEDYFKALGIST